MILQKQYYGCEKEDYFGANFTGRAAFIYDSPLCTYETKVKLAAEAGAAIVVVVNAAFEEIETMFIGRKLKKIFNNGSY